MVKIFTQEMYDFIMANYKGHTVPELAKMMEKEFGQAVDVHQLRSWLKLRKLRNGVDTRLGSQKHLEIRRQKFQKKDVYISAIYAAQKDALEKIRKGKEDECKKD